MCMCVCRGEAFLVLLLKCCCCCSIINYFHIMPVEQWKYNMCDVAPHPGHSRQSWGGDDGTQWQLYRAASRQGAALPTPDMPGPALARNIGAEEIWVFSAFYNGPRPPPEILHFYVWINFLPISISIQSCCACVHTSWECVPEPEVGGKSRGLALSGEVWILMGHSV